MKVIRISLSAAFVCLLSLIIFFSNESLRAQAYDTVSAQIPVKCLKVSDNSDHFYDIRIEAENENSPAPDTDTLRIEEDSTGMFEIIITEPGTFLYRITETAGSDPQIKYDSNVYIVTVFVITENDGKLVWSVTAQIEGQDHKTESVDFENTVLSDKEEPTDSSQARTEPPEDDSQTSSETDPTLPPETTAANTSAENDHKNQTISDIIDNVITGNSFPAYAVRIMLIACVVIALSAVLLKRNESKEEDEHEE